jgi:hypothetical protein
MVPAGPGRSDPVTNWSAVFFGRSRRTHLISSAFRNRRREDINGDSNRNNHKGIGGFKKQNLSGGLTWFTQSTTWTKHISPAVTARIFGWTFFGIKMDKATKFEEQPKNGSRWGFVQESYRSGLDDDWQIYSVGSNGNKTYMGFHK